jgi:hypothetical protein
MSGDSGAGSLPKIGIGEVLAFGCELAMLAALAVVGWLLAPSRPVAIALAFALPALMGLVWGLWLAPRARHRLQGPLLTGAKVAIFVLTGGALVVAGHAGWGMALAAVGGLNTVMLARRDARRHPRVP